MIALWMSLLPSISIIGCSDKGITSHNNTPEATITSHTNISEVMEGYEISLQGIVSDGNHNNSDLSVTWSSNQRELCPAQAPLVDGTTICNTVLNPNDTEIKLVVVDPESSSFVASISITVIPTEAPIVNILSPVAAGAYYNNIPIGFAATITDAEDESSALNFTWQSSIDGELNTSANLDENGNFATDFTLSEGNHTISLIAEDSTGKTGQASLDIVVSGANSDPYCAITAPDSLSAYQQGDTVQLQANARDDESEYNVLTTS